MLREMMPFLSKKYIGYSVFNNLIHFTGITASSVHCSLHSLVVFDTITTPCMCVRILAGLVKPTRDWKNLGPCLKVIQHIKEGGSYNWVAVNSKGLLAVTDGANNRVHLLTKEGALVRSIGEGILRG